MYLHHNIESDLVIDTEKIKRRAMMIEQIKDRFMTNGYDEIYTSTFEHYDLYAKMNGSVNRREMIKTIDNSGNVLVLRPDITIPITQQLAMNNETLTKDLRYFYMLDVFRQAELTNEYVENTQAGIEYFGYDAPEADAEVIAIAAHLLQDLHIEDFKIEIGHAGFFQKLIEKIDVPQEDLAELIHLIQSKNVAEIELLLRDLAIDEKMKEVMVALPFLYGKPDIVLKKAKTLPLNDCLRTLIERLEATYEILCAYELERYLTIDFSLINQMDYYSGVIFQGFIPNIGRPVLMGGRYNTLGNYFQANIPAIGFAANVELLLDGIDTKEKEEVNIVVLYEASEIKQALQLAKQLREKQIKTVTYDKGIDLQRIREDAVQIFIEKEKNYILLDGDKIPFQTVQGIIHRLKERT